MAFVRHLDSGTDLTSDEDLLRLYAYPPGPWVRANFVASIDGAAAVGGLSGGLGTPSDKRVFGLLRELADVVLVGAGTARAEGYRGARLPAPARERRRVAGQGPVPPVAVVSARAALDPAGPLFTDTAVAPIVLTRASAPRGAREGLRAAGARVLEVGEDPGELVAALHGLGLRRVLCEGGPSLLGQLAQADVVDEVCLTTAPVLALGPAPRITGGGPGAVVPMRRAHTVVAGDGAVFTRWVRPR